MTELQLDAVRDEASIFLGDIFRDYQDRRVVLDLIIDDVVADIDETADWSNYEEDEYSLSDIQISLARVLKRAVETHYVGTL